MARGLAKNPYGTVFRSLMDKEMVAPYLKNAVLAGNWPRMYNIPVDSSPYYGTDDGYFHPSTHGLLGARRLYYEFHPETRAKMVWEDRDLSDEMLLAMGSALHAVVQTQLQQVGILRSENVEKEFIITRHHVRGRTDMVVDHPTAGLLPVEFKTMNVERYRFIKQPMERWEVQLGMALYGLGYDYGILLLMQRGDPYDMQEFPIERNNSLLEPIFAKFDYVREAIRRDEPPEHCCGFRSPEMKKCPARYVCWLKSEVQDG